MLRRSIVAGLGVLVLALGAGAALAATQETTDVGGSQTPGVFGPCADPSAVQTMEGDLSGCWYVDDLTCRLNPSGTVQCTGHEHFVGSLGSKTGTFSTTFEFTGKFDGPPTFAEIHGRCHHPIVGGTGDFAGASGVLQFKDDVTTGVSTYRGHITL